jgi:hypothetical protein
MTAAVNNSLGSLLVNSYATPPITNQTGLDEGIRYIKLATCAIPAVATDLAGSTYRFCQVSSSDIVTALLVSSTALTAGAISYGLYTSNSAGTGAVVSVALFATSVSFASAVTQTDKRFTSLALTTMGQRVWQLLGLSADPQLTYDLVGTSTTGATAAGTLAVQYEYTK